jgi:hypothetical protein
MGKFNLKNGKDFQKTKKEAELFYQEIEEVYCPYFKEKIKFNAKGLKHLKFKGDRTARSRSDQYTRLKLLFFAPEVISLSKTVQGIWDTKSFERVRVHSRTDTILKNISYYEFIAVLENTRLKVIIKQVGNGKKFFWSVIPYWKIDSKNSRRVLHSGNPERD